jgi:stalled ribosome rescue protein Dom34
MSERTHVAVWLDHQEARIFGVDLDGFDEQTLSAPQHHFHRHPKGSSEPASHPEDERHFFAAITGALVPAEQILLLGPSTAKSQLLKYLQDHAPAVVTKVVAVEASDHPTDAQIVAHVRKHFRIPELRVR